MFDKYNARYDNIAYQKARIVIHFATTTEHEEIQVSNHILDMAEWLSGVTYHPDCPPQYKKKLERAIRRLPVYEKAIGMEQFNTWILPFLMKFI